MRNIIITTSVVFIAVMVTSYFYFSNLKQDDPLKHKEAEQMEVDQHVEDAPTGRAHVWTFNLHANLSTKPIVHDLDSTNRFILVQDAYHILYAISANGQQLWNAQLPGPILGGIQQLADRSLVFTTADRLYRIDTEGDPLPGFSLQLPQKATLGAIASDVNEREIRIDVPTKNRALSYDGRGRNLRSQTRKTTLEQTGIAQEPGVQNQGNDTLRLETPTDCGPLFYIGPLRSDDSHYLLCGQNDRKLHCYVYRSE